MIVCDGAKTEPLYFSRLREVYRLSSANIHVTPADGSDPMSIVRYAEAHGGDFDKIYCVFDRNGHQNYDTAAFTAVGGRSSCDNVVRELRQHVQDYSKGRREIFDDLHDMLDDAITHAKRLQRDGIDNNFFNLSKRVHELVEYLIGLKQN